MLLNVLYRQSILKLKKAGIKSAELDARVLICFCLDIMAEQFYLMQNDALSPSQIKKIKIAIQKCAQNLPVAYITGHKEFFGLDFEVNKNVLIPRPETEWIVEKSIKSIGSKNRSAEISDEIIKSKVHKVAILDLGTGCGNIIIAITMSLRARRGGRSNLFFASDISPSALAVAKKNARIHHVDKKIKFIKSDLFSNLKNLKFDIIIANLPYVPTKNSAIQQLSHEPFATIFATDNGADIIKRFLKSAPDHLNDNGMIILELDPRNALDIKKYAKKYFPRTKIRLEKDLANFWRYLIIQND